MRQHFFVKERDEDATVWSSKVSSITICMVRFVLYNYTSQHFVSHEGIMFACGFVLKSDLVPLEFVRHSRQKLYRSATRPLSDFRMGPGNEASVAVCVCACMVPHLEHKEVLGLDEDAQGLQVGLVLCLRDNLRD